uniref:SCP domain-containing protein n=1 Tax=Mesocestoides corti TaxID=53468 RepID=A0A5K3FLB7_MESCO
MILATASAISCAQIQRTIQGVFAAETAYLTACLYKPSKAISADKPYNKGNSCSACPDRLTCQRKQCVSIASVETTSPLPDTSISSTTSTTSVSSMLSRITILYLLYFLCCLLA